MSIEAAQLALWVAEPLTAIAFCAVVAAVLAVYGIGRWLSAS